MTADGVGGVWQYATDLAEALGELGIEVLLAVMGPALNPDQREDAVARGLHIAEGAYRLEWMDDPWDDVADAGAWLLQLEREFAPDIVHLNGYCHAPLPWRAPAIVVGHSCVRSWWRAVHGEAAPASWDRYSRAVRDGLRAARLVITPTAAMREALLREYGVSGETLVIPNARAGTEAIAGVAAKSAYVFAAGRTWDEAKNITALRDVAPFLPWPVMVAGDGGPVGSRGSVHWLGRVPASTMVAWYRRAAIYALPARYEPFGLSILEAAAAGCALVLGDIDSLRENWEGTAVFVSPDDREALATAITRLIAEPQRREELGRRAAARARTFTLRNMVAGYAAAYESARHSAGAPRAGGNALVSA